MTTPPFRTETLLAALAADAPYRDDILGDLAEDFAIHVEEQGVREARRWYRRQALRTAPHLLRQWAMRLGAFDVARLIAWTLLTEVTTQLFWLAARAVIVASFGVVPDSVGIVDLAWRSLVRAEAVSINWGYLSAAASSVLVGYGIAHVERRAALGTCVVIGAAASLILLIGGFLDGSPPAWPRIAVVLIVGSGIAAGGALAALGNAARQRTATD
jgi:hypothetical protein